MSNKWQKLLQTNNKSGKIFEEGNDSNIFGLLVIYICEIPFYYL